MQTRFPLPFISLPFPSLPFPALLSPLPSFSLSPILPFLFLSSPPLIEVGPLYPARSSGERCKLPQWGLGGAPAEIDFGAF